MMTPLPEPFNEWEVKHLESCDSSVRIRRLMELAIVRKLVNTILLDGYTISVDGGGEDFDLSRSTDVEAIMDATFAVDEATLFMHTLPKTPIGWVSLVHGNGVDIISDWTTNLDYCVDPATIYAERLRETWL